MSSNSQPVFRFAPSPNGRLHLGHAYSALYTWVEAQKVNGTVLLRIEDIDRERSKPQFVNAIYEDLKWLGLSWPEPVMLQSTRFAIYQKALDKLQDAGLVYPCFCSRTEIAARSRDKVDPDGAPLYTGFCGQLSDDDVQDRIFTGLPVKWRLDMDRAIEKAGPLTYEVVASANEGEVGTRKANPAVWGDVVLARNDIPSSYHLSVVTDDASQKVTHVTRGGDLEQVTDVHVLLQKLLGLPTPVYSFHKLLRDKEGEKLSKSKGSPSLKDLRERGVSAADIRRRLGFKGRPPPKL